MAFVEQGWKYTATVIDTGGNTTTRTFFLIATDDAGDLSPVIDAVTAINTALTAVTDAVITKQEVSKVTVNDSVTLPSGDVNVEENLQISAKIDGMPNKSAVIEIPAPKNALFQAPTGPGHNQADFTVTALGNYVNLFKTTCQAKVSDGENITDQNIKGKRVHHKSSKG
jgi:hypothetical protein